MPEYTELEENELDIQNRLINNRNALIEALMLCYDEDTNEHFFDEDWEDDGTSLIDLCEMATRIQSMETNVATFPSPPNILKQNTLCNQELNIYNKIQYCNNLLRYSLKKNGINFNNSNKMHELIYYITLINSTKLFKGYISDVYLTADDNIKVTYISYDDLETSNVVKNLSYDDANLFVEIGPYDGDYDNLYVDLELQRNGNLKCTRIRDWV